MEPVAIALALIFMFVSLATATGGPSIKSKMSEEVALHTFSGLGQINRYP